MSSSDTVFQIKIDASQANRLLDQLLIKTPQFTSHIIAQAAPIIEKNMRATVPVKTGTLQASISSQASGETAEIGTHSGYGLFVDVGTKPHIIEGHPVLRFIIDGKPVYARRVHHPGSKGRHFREQTIERSSPDIESLLETAISDLVEG